MIESAGEIVVDSGRPAREPPAWPWLGAVAGAVTALLIAVANRHGYHRDALYFIRAGSEPAFGYADQPPLTPLLAHGLLEGSLVGLRLPSAVMAGIVVLLTGLIARELGAGRSHLAGSRGLPHCGSVDGRGHGRMREL